MQFAGALLPAQSRAPQTIALFDEIARCTAAQLDRLDAVQLADLAWALVRVFMWVVFN